MTRTFILPEEPSPREFAARFTRNALAQHRRHRGRRAAVLLAAVAVPAFAAPSNWSAFKIGNAGAATLEVEPMPFERPGASFPGSAFYYLAPDRPLAPLAHSDAEPVPADPVVGPAARAMRTEGSWIDRTRALQCLTAAIYYEAASEPDSGQRAVAQVVLNRVAHPSYPSTVCGVVFQGSERTTGCQFSFTCDGALARVPNRMFWQRAEDVARAALAGYVHAPVGLATHYHTVQIYPYWAPSLHFLGTIGAHRFYRFRGPAGQMASFRFAYTGNEPVAAPHPRKAGADALPGTAPDPVAIQRAYEQGLKVAQATVVQPTVTGLTSIRAAPAPVYAEALQARGGETLHRADRLPEATGIRPEYAQSGKWIDQPGT
jgi:hypothetical protein